MAKAIAQATSKFDAGTLLAQGVYANLVDKGGFDKKDRTGKVTGTLTSVVANRVLDSRIVDENGNLLLRNMGIFNPPSALFFPSAGVDKHKQSPGQSEYLAYVALHPSAGVLVVNISIATTGQLELLTPFITDTPMAVNGVVGQGI